MYPSSRRQDRLPNEDHLRTSIDGMYVPGGLTAVAQRIGSLSNLSIVGHEARGSVALVYRLNEAGGLGAPIRHALSVCSG